MHGVDLSKLMLKSSEELSYQSLKVAMHITQTEELATAMPKEQVNSPSLIYVLRK